MLVVLGMRPGLWTAHLAVTLVAAHIPGMQALPVYKTVSSILLANLLFYVHHVIFIVCTMKWRFYCYVSETCTIKSDKIPVLET